MTESGIRVLYVDDDPALVRLVQRALGRNGFRVEHAAGDEEALASMASKKIDVIALDHYLASGTGLDLLSRLAVITGSPPVVYVTGSTDMSVAVAALKAGAADLFRRRSATILSFFSARHCSRLWTKLGFAPRRKPPKTRFGPRVIARRSYYPRSTIASPTAWRSWHPSSACRRTR